MRRILGLFLALLLLGGCSGESGSYEHSIFAMDTYMTFRVYGRGAQAQTQELVRHIQALDAELSATNPQSPVYTLNQNGSGQVPQELADLLAASLELSQQTNGALDLSVYPLVRLWGFPTETYRVPSEEEIAAALAYVGSEHIHQDGCNIQLDAGTQLDFGAVAKGYAGQVCADLLAENGVEAALLSLGGNVQTLGSKPDGSDWAIGITDPDNPSTYFATLRLSGTHSIVTSGGYNRYFEFNGQRYHHILDPSTGKPAHSGLASVTVVTSDGFLADALSTALYVLGLEQAAALYRSRADFEAVFVTDSGGVYVTEGLTDAFSGSSYEVIPA